MNDELIKRLRFDANDVRNHHSSTIANRITEAADLIEQQAARIAELEAQLANAGENITDLEAKIAAPRGSSAQILMEREITASSINGAMAFGYQGTNPPPSNDHWLAPYWNIARKQAALEAQAAPVAPAVDAQPVAWMYKCWDTIHLEKRQIDHYYSIDRGETYVKGVPLYTNLAPALKDSVRREALEEGYALGFAASGEGWNGEYPARDLTIDPRWIKQRDEDIGRALSQKESGE